ncbi:MAG TPA: DUF1206 domain-containing protein [Ktedonobacteraceae bacterium]|nr:DUF1206 domain-containing protein [Ktedonobacteraceae bacterium]
MAERGARNAATRQWMTLLARCGYAAKGVVYLIIGVIAAQVAIGARGAVTDQKGALETILAQPFGHLLLGIVAIGLFGFALWCFLQAVFDTEGKGTTAKGLIARIGYAAVGLSYAALALGAFQFVVGSGTGGKGSNASAQDGTALLLKQPFGPALVIIVGLLVFGIAFFLFYTAYTAKFQTQLQVATLGAQIKKWVIAVGRAGYAALGVVASITGIFLIVAAFQNNASKAIGLDGVLQELAHQPFGQVLLGILALGLFAYGIYSVSPCCKN